MVDLHNRRVAKGKSVAETVVSAAEIIAATPDTRVRQSHKKPSKIHRDWGEHLNTIHRAGLFFSAQIYEEAITLNLCNGVRYRPDWIVVGDFSKGPKHLLTAYECKGGFMYDDARKSLLFAAKEYRWIRFVLVWREKGEWKQQEILPA
jgi:hypothetical protein